MWSRDFLERWLTARHSWLLPIGFWLLISGASLWINLQSVDNRAIEMATERGRNMFEIIQLTREWNAQHGGVYAPVSDHLQPNPYLQDPRRDITSSDGLKLTKINPAFMTRQISELAAKRGVLFHITSLNPIRPGNIADDWETEALKRFEKQEIGELTQLVEQKGQRKSFRYMAPLIVKPACMACHAVQGYSIGDIRGGISVNIDPTPILQRSDQEKRNLTLIHGIFFILITSLSLSLFLRHRRHLLDLEQLTEQQERKIIERTSELRSANQQLQQAKEEYQSLFEHSPDGILKIDPRTLCATQFNPAAHRNLGYSREEFEKLTINDYEAGRSPQQVADHGRQLFESNKPLGFETRYLRKDGNLIDVFVSTQHIETPQESFILAIFRDITEIKTAQRLIEESERSFRGLVQNSPIPMLVTRLDDRVELVNDTFSRTFGYQFSELERAPHWMNPLFPEPKYRDHIARAMRRDNPAQPDSGQTDLMESEITCKDGTTRIVRLSVAKVGTHRIITFVDLTRLKNFEKKLEVMATTDALTGLSNRYQFDAVYRHEWLRCRRNRKPLTLVIMDIDYFKDYNDHYGHLAGDHCLRRIGSLLAAAGQRPTDHVFRFGGEEFICLLSEVDLKGGLTFAERLRERLHGLRIPHEHTRISDRITASMGVACAIPNEDTQPDTLIQQADEALYQAKNGGRNCIRHNGSCPPADDQDPTIQQEPTD